MIKKIRKIVKDWLYNKYKVRLYEEYKNDIRDYYINQTLPLYGLKMSDKKIMSILADLYQDEGYRVLVRLWCNRKNSLGRELLRRNIHGAYKDAYEKGFYRGQSYFISHFISLLKHIYNQNENEK